MHEFRHGSEGPCAPVGVERVSLSIDRPAERANPMHAEHSKPGSNPLRLTGTVEDIVANLDATTSMKPQPDQSLKEVLAGLVERVTYHNVRMGSACCGSRHAASAIW